MTKKILISLLLLLFGFSGGYYAGSGGGLIISPAAKGKIQVLHKEPPQQVTKTLDMDLFWRVLDELETRYLNHSELDAQTMLYGAVKGMVSSVGDPYTSFFTPEQNHAFQQGLEGVYEGIGAQLGFKDQKLVIVAPLDGSPTEAAGVKAGDAILAVDGESTQGWSLPQAVSKIRGKEGTKVVLMLEREGKDLEGGDCSSNLDQEPQSTNADSCQKNPFEVQITRQQIKIPSIRLNWVGDNQEIAHLQVLRFGTDTNREWDEQVDRLSIKLAQGQLKGVVLDLRNNPGGLLDAAIHLASEFFADGVVVKRELATGKIEEFKVDHPCRMCKVPLVVLVNQGSASASEIVAGAVKARERGLLVGEKTFGKGTVQEAIELGDGANLHVTTARWLLPDGSNIHKVGIQPNVPVSLSVDEVSDLQLDKALEQLLNQPHEL